MIQEEFGSKAGRQAVVEKRLEGEELSVLALVGGRAILPLPPTQDHKAALDGDKGPNTGGMGAYCPAPKGTPELMAKVESEVFVPVVHAMKRGRYPFNGLLYGGIILTNQGPRVLEFNARFGDPETQPLLMRLKSDLLDLLEAVVDENALRPRRGKVDWDPRPAVCVVMASGGYPGKYEAGKPIAGLDEVSRMADVKVFHAGTRAGQRPGRDRRRPRARRDGPGRHAGGRQEAGLRGGPQDQVQGGPLPHRHRGQGPEVVTAVTCPPLGK